MTDTAKRRAGAGRQRQVAVWMFWFGGVQFIFWIGIFVLTVLDVGHLQQHFESVYWVSLLSIYANMMTVFCIVPSSWAGMAAADSHHEASRSRQEGDEDTAQIEEDIARLADLEPGREGHELAKTILTRVKA